MYWKFFDGKTSSKFIHWEELSPSRTPPSIRVLSIWSKVPPWPKLLSAPLDAYIAVYDVNIFCGSDDENYLFSDIILLYY